MNASTLQFAEFWADELLSVVEQSGNSFANIEKMFSQMVKKMAIKGVVMGALNLISGGTFAAGFMGSLGFKLPGKAGGGDVEKGVPYLVGERRAEIFVPDQAGKILPGKAGGGDVEKGVPYLVGERRAEIFVPDQAGKILPGVGDYKRSKPPHTILNHDLYDIRMKGSPLNPPVGDLKRGAALRIPELPWDMTRAGKAITASTTIHDDHSVTTEDHSDHSVIHISIPKGENVKAMDARRFAELYKQAKRDRYITREDLKATP
jgi:hypothetical protein